MWLFPLKYIFLILNKVWGNSCLEIFLAIIKLIRIYLKVFFSSFCNCVQCLNDGVRYLMKMLSFRCPLRINEDVSLQDKDTARLLSEGKQKSTTSDPNNYSTFWNALCTFVIWLHLYSKLSFYSKSKTSRHKKQACFPDSLLIPYNFFWVTDFRSW